TSVKWGIPVPGDPNHVIYVWFDALVGYLTGIGFGNGVNKENFGKFWPAQVQLVGKDILRFHAVYWPAFLMAAGLALPRQVFAHGWWLKDEVKMSKSRGNVIDPILLLEHFGSDAVRYFLLREVPLGLDGSFSYEALIQRVNSDLANDFGNLVSRTLTLISKNFANTIPYPSAFEARRALVRKSSRPLWTQSRPTRATWMSWHLAKLWNLCGNYCRAPTSILTRAHPGH
ncbi:MAG: methionine--tRNA ligase, partial [Acidobacteria bacterium]